ncbi:hypothetical protein [Celeribacter neptunius]|uniref:hypothetical protein n=1 Tax=Celeribacter neptunius TaxID=588602 RepID=UPI001160BEFB|nr:hypothetical protein [Celeribacter neptunius]
MIENLPGVRDVLMPANQAVKGLDDTKMPSDQAALRRFVQDLLALDFATLDQRFKAEDWRAFLNDALLVLKYARLGKPRPIGRLAELLRLCVALFDKPAADQGNWLGNVLAAPFVIPAALSGTGVENTVSDPSAPGVRAGLPKGLLAAIDDVLRLAGSEERARVLIETRFAAAGGQGNSEVERAVMRLRNHFVPARPRRPRLALTHISGVPVMADVAGPARSSPVASFGAEARNFLADLGIDALAWDVAHPGMAPGGTPDQEQDRGPSLLQPAGRSDLLLVKETLTGYRLADIEYISNTMIGETLEARKTRRATREEEFIERFESISENVEEVEKADSTAVRNAASDIVREDLATAGSVTVSSRGPTKITAEGSVAYDKSTETSAERAQEFARETIRRAIERTQETRQYSRRTLFRVETTQDDFRTSQVPPTADAHVTGIYQYLEKVSRARLYNYGERDLYDLIVPEPAALLWALSMSQPQARIPLLEPDADLYGELTVENIGDRLEEVIRAFGVFDIPAKPKDEQTVSYAASQTGKGNSAKLAASKDVSIPDGYVADTADIAISVETEGDISPNGGVSIADQTETWLIPENELDGNLASRQINLPLNGINGPQIPVAFNADNFSSITITVVVRCTVTDEYKRQWALKAFGKVTEAYERMRRNFETAVQQANALDTDRDVNIPSGTHRRLQRMIRFELQRAAIAIMRNDPPSFDLIRQLAVGGAPAEELHPIPDLDQLDTSGPEIRFLSQAFEWEHMTSILYPYFWGRRSEWKSTVLQTHADHEFGEFLRAGAARVQVPVTPGFEDLVKHYMETREVYGGNDMPSMGSPGYLSYVDERLSQDGAPGNERLWPPDNPAEWDIVRPTSFVMLRDAAKPGLPSWNPITGEPDEQP